MKDFFKSLKVGMLLSALTSLVLGFFMMFSPDVVNNVLRSILGGGLSLFGALEIVFVFAKPNGLLSVGRVVPGVLSLAVGLVFFFRFETFVSLLWILLGVSLLIDGIYKLQYAFELKAVLVKTWWINLLMSLAALVMAAVLMIQPFDVQKSMTVFAGVLLAVNGLFDLASIGIMLFFRKRLRDTTRVLICDAEEGESPKEQALMEK